MSPRQRWLRTVQGQRPDRVPLELEGFRFRTREAVDALADSGRCRIAHRVFDETHYGVHCSTFINRWLVTPPRFIRETSRREGDGEVERTCEVETPKGPLTAATVTNALSDTVWTRKYPVESLEDIDRIRSVPWEVPEGLAPPDLDNLPDDFHERGIVTASISSPFVCVAGMMPYEYFLELCVTERALVEELTALCHQRIMDVLEVILAEESVECVWMGGCEWLTPPMGSLDLYQRLVQPYEQAIIERVHAAGGLVHVHCHGNIRSTLPLVIARGGDYCEPVEPPPDGDITFAEAKALAAGRITLGGNVEARVLEYGRAQVVEDVTRACFQGTRERMVLRNTATPIGAMSPRMLENYGRMIDVWEELSLL